MKNLMTVTSAALLVATQAQAEFLSCAYFEAATILRRAAVYRCWKRVRSDRYATMTLLMLIRHRCRLLAEFDVGREQVRRNHRASTRGSRTLRLVQGIDAFIGF